MSDIVAVAARAPARRLQCRLGLHQSRRATRPAGSSRRRGSRGSGWARRTCPEKHANFIQADKGGRADDVHALMEHVAPVVAERCGVTLRAEVRLLGFGDGKTGEVTGVAAGGQS